MEKVNKQCLLDPPQIAPSKAVVGVERPIKALFMHIQKSYKVIIV